MIFERIEAFEGQFSVKVEYYLFVFIPCGFNF